MKKISFKSLRNFAKQKTALTLDEKIMAFKFCEIGTCWPFRLYIYI